MANLPNIERIEKLILNVINASHSLKFQIYASPHSQQFVDKELVAELRRELYTLNEMINSELTGENHG